MSINPRMKAMDVLKDYSVWPNEGGAGPGDGSQMGALPSRWRDHLWCRHTNRGNHEDFSLVTATDPKSAGKTLWAAKLCIHL